MSMKAGSWQQKSIEGSKPLRWDAIGDFWKILTRPCDEIGGPQQNPGCIWSAWWSPNNGKETKTHIVWPISRSSGMAKTILQETVKGASRRGRQKKRWKDNIKEWTGMGLGDSLWAAEDREGWKGIVATSSVVPRRPARFRDWDEMRRDEMRRVLGYGQVVKTFPQWVQISPYGIFSNSFFFLTFPFSFLIHSLNKMFLF